MNGLSRWDTTSASDVSETGMAPNHVAFATPSDLSGIDNLRYRSKQPSSAVKSELMSSLSVAGRMSLDSTIKASTFHKGNYQVTASTKRNPRDLTALANTSHLRRIQPSAPILPNPAFSSSSSAKAKASGAIHGTTGSHTSSVFPTHGGEVKSQSTLSSATVFASPASGISSPNQRVCRGYDCEIGRKYPQPLRRPLIQRPWLRPVSALHIAALTIQTAWRRCRARRALRLVIEAVEQEPKTLYLHKRLPMIAAWAAHGSAALVLSGLNPAQLQRLSQAQQKQKSLLETQRSGQHQSSGSESVSQQIPGTSTDRAMPSARSSAPSFKSMAAERDHALMMSRKLDSIPESRKRELLVHLPFAIAAFVIQRAWRARIAGREGRRRALPLIRRHRAARAIQRAWRGFRDKRIFRHLKDLVLGRTLSDPIQLMKVICPSEAHIADAASGLYVRFRLGGPTFPPLLFYKIYTMRPVADIGAFAPRNYAAQAALATAATQSRLIPDGLAVEHQQPSPAQLRVNGSPTNSVAAAYSAACEEWERNRRRRKYLGQPGPGMQSSESLDPRLSQLIESCKEWYRRCDNNGWRLVSGAQVTALNPKLERFLNIGQPRPPQAPEYPHPYFYTHASALAARRGGFAEPVHWDAPGPLAIARAVAVPSADAKPYHPDRLVRHVDAIKRKKRTKLRWLQNLYRLAMSQSSSSSSTTSTMLNTHEQLGAPDTDEENQQDDVGVRKMGGDIVLFDKSSYSAKESKDQGAVNAPTLVGQLLLGANPEAEEVCMPAFWDELGAAAADDDIITWAAGLDFETYARDWGCLGTSRPARAPPPLDEVDTSIAEELSKAK